MKKFLENVKDFYDFNREKIAAFFFGSFLIFGLHDLADLKLVWALIDFALAYFAFKGSNFQK